MVAVVCWVLFVVWCLSTVVGCCVLYNAVVVRRRWPLFVSIVVVACVVCWLLFVVCCLWLLFVVCCCLVSLFVVCC